MKRRGFLTMLGAAAATPILPTGVPTLGPKLKALGVAHAQKFPFVSVMGLSNSLSLSKPEAADLLDYLTRQDVVGLPNSTGTGLPSGPSKVFRPVAIESELASAANGTPKSRVKCTKEPVETSQVATKDWVTHLQTICVRNGVSLQPRALEVVAA